MSLNLDFSEIWTQASSFVNGLWPIFVIPIGMVLGIGILSFIVKTIKSSLASIH